METSVLIVIPARIGSTRYPEKPLAQIAGKSMLERVWRIAASVKGNPTVVVATDSERIRDHAVSFGAQVLLTSETCRTGTDRVAETAKSFERVFDLIFSFQGDAPLMPPWVLEQVIAEMVADPSIEIATPAVQLSGEALDRFVSEKRQGRTTGTAVVFGKNRDALYFSKGLIPNPRSGSTSGLPLYLHIGLYGYRRPTLERFASLPEGDLERVEKLEQLRALENGIPIRVVPVDLQGRSLHSVDSPDDVKIVEQIIEAEGELLPFS